MSEPNLRWAGGEDGSMSKVVFFLDLGGGVGTHLPTPRSTPGGVGGRRTLVP